MTKSYQKNYSTALKKLIASAICSVSLSCVTCATKSKSAFSTSRDRVYFWCFLAALLSWAPCSLFPVRTGVQWTGSVDAPHSLCKSTLATCRQSHPALPGYVSWCEDLAAADGPFVTGQRAIRFLLHRLRPSQLLEIHFWRSTLQHFSGMILFCYQLLAVKQAPRFLPSIVRGRFA